MSTMNEDYDDEITEDPEEEEEERCRAGSAIYQRICALPT